MTARIPCRAVFLDAGGVIVLPDRHLLAGALARAGIRIDPDAVPRAHYRAVRNLDRALTPPRTHALTPAPSHAPTDAPADGPTHATDPGTATATRSDYVAALLSQLGIVPGQAAEAFAVWEGLADRRRSRAVLWSEPTPGAADAIASLKRAGMTVGIVTNSDGHGEENLRASGFGGVPVIDSTVVGAAKPDPHIFEIALRRAGAAATETVHVGDTLLNDVAGARATGIIPIHFDPLRTCRAPDHRHVRTVTGLWQHIAPAP
ncbi:MAG: HAD-IA family hydrolase [Solirubrobacterales bacterium]|nr:HAD-IA family hydrolase [Solirubrobacterales bacterium]